MNKDIEPLEETRVGYIAASVTVPGDVWIAEGPERNDRYVLLTEDEAFVLRNWLNKVFGGRT